MVRVGVLELLQEPVRVAEAESGSERLAVRVRLDGVPRVGVGRD